MLKNLFYKNLFAIQYILRNKIEAILLVDTYVTRYSFINKRFVKEIC